MPPGSRSSAASPPTPSCGPSLPEAAAAPLALCTDNAAMIASAARYVRACRRSPSPGRLCGGVAAPALAVAGGNRGGRGASSSPREVASVRRRRPSRLEAAAAWSGLVGGARAPVGDRPARARRAHGLLARRPRPARGRPGQRRRRAALDVGGGRRAGAVHLEPRAARGSSVKPEFRFTRTLNGFSAVLDPRAIALVERTPGVKGVYPVRVAFPASLSPRALRQAACDRAEARSSGSPASAAAA